MIPRKIFTNFAKFRRIVRKNDFLVSTSTPRTFVSFFLFPEKFWFCKAKIESIELPRLVPRLRIDDCFEIHFLHWELCDPLQSSHQHVPLWARLYLHVFCKKPSLSQFGSFRKCVYTLCLPKPRFHFRSRPIGGSWRWLGNVLTSLLWVSPWLCWSTFINPILSDLHVANQAIHAIFLFVLLLILHFFGSRGFMQRVSPKLSTRTSTSFLYWIFGVFVDIKYGILWWRWWRIEWKCSWGRTRPWTKKHKWYIVRFFCNQLILLPFLMRCGFWPLIQWCVDPWSSQSFSKERTAGISSRNITLTG